MTENKESHAVLQGNGVFTRNLYALLSKQAGNVFFSPISAHTVLSMAHQGANGDTKQAFSNVLKVPADTKIAAEGYKHIMSRLNDIPNVTLLLANKIYVKDGYSLQASFKDIITKSFQSEIQLLNFKDSVNAARTINSWVEEKTKNRIKDLIKSDALDETTALVLVNAIYFKGAWADKFDPKDTKPETFYLNDKDATQVDMMFRKGKYFYKRDEALEAQVLELPYANQDLVLTVILPARRNGIEELEKRLAETDLTKISDGMHKPDVNVWLPKFKIEQTINLQDALTELGLGIIFDPHKAELTGLIDSKEELHVSKVIQKAFIEVNEEGAEAAAATGMIMAMRMALVPRPPEDFRADHPFVILLTQKQGEHTHILFHGRVSKPEKN